VLQSVAVCCSLIEIDRLSDTESSHVLQCVAVCCSVLHCVAVRCRVLQCVAVLLKSNVSLIGSHHMCCSVLQRVAVCCVLQCVAY